MNDRLSPIEVAKARHLLADVAGRTGITIPAGRAGLVTVRCPMPSHGHHDRTPSLRLHLERDLWWCFACSPTGPDGTPRAGDVVEWVRQTEQVDWRAAIDILDSGRPLTNAWAGSTGAHGRTLELSRHSGAVELPDLDRTPRVRVQQAVDAAWSYYSYGPLHARGVLYLAGRHININLLERHNRRAEVGHTPASATGLVDRLRARGFTPDELVDAGLAHRRIGSDHLVDFYRQRVLIPVRDPDGGLAGLIGRNVGDARWPKYKNPPRTVLYDKSVNLYQPLMEPLRRDGHVVVVEGTIDALAIAVAAVRSHRASSFCPITQSGRELSSTQLSRVLAMHPTPPIIAMDGDSAGRESTARLAGVAAAAGSAVLVTHLPDGDDPASWIAAHGPAGLHALMRPERSAGLRSSAPPSAQLIRRKIDRYEGPATRRVPGL